MRTQDEKTKGTKHILEYDFFKDNTSRYIDDIVFKVKKILTSPESALLLRDMYDKEFNLNQGSVQDDLIGQVLYRDKEDPYKYTRYNLLTDYYIKFDIKKFFNLSIIEFMNLAKYERTTLIEKAREEILRLTDTVADIKEESGIDSLIERGEFDFGE